MLDTSARSQSNRAMTEKRAIPVVKILPSSYKPTKAALEEDVSVDATPDDVARSLTRTVTIKAVREEFLACQADG